MFFCNWASSFERGGLFAGQMLGQLREVAGHLFAFGIAGEEGAQVGLVLAQQRDDFGQVGGLGLPEAVGHAGGGDIDAVEHVADVVQDAPVATSAMPAWREASSNSLCAFSNSPFPLPPSQIWG